MNEILAGVGRALLFKGNDLIGVAKTLTESTMDFTIESEEIRGGEGNTLFGRYYHDSNLAVTLTDAMFNLEYIAASLGVNVEQGGLVVYESGQAGEEITTVGSITVTNTPVAFGGSLLGWYKKPADENWNIGTFTGNTMAIPGAAIGEHYCIKYFYQDPNARMITIKAQYVPNELHVVILNDLFYGELKASTTGEAKIGKLITDIPRLQLDGAQNLSLTATGAATVSLAGTALAVVAGDSCEEDLMYGTMTELIYNTKWQDNVIALAIQNSEIEVGVGAKETLQVRVVYGKGMASELKDNSNFTFTSATPATATVEADTGEVTGVAAGTTNVTVALTGYPNLAPAIAEVTVTA